MTRTPFASLQDFFNSDPDLSMLLQLSIPSYTQLARTDVVATALLPRSDVGRRRPLHRCASSDQVHG